LIDVTVPATHTAGSMAIRGDYAVLTAERVEGIYDYIGARVRAARIDTSMSQDELGLRVGLTRTSISNIELGHQKVQIHTLYDIATVLGVPLASLLPPAPDQADVEERYLKKLSLAEREWVKTVLATLPAKEGRGRRAEKPAVLDGDPEKLLARLGINAPPVPVDRVAQQCGAEIRYVPYEGEMSGLLLNDGERIIIGINSSDPKVRQRFAVAHELGHLALHGDKELHVDRNFSSVRGAGAQAKINQGESEANDFAVSMLIPAPMITFDLKGRPVDYSDREKMDGLAERYKVGPEVMTYRLMRLNSLVKS
jgi:transcriptional regulator with XRE-family HTH domain